MTTEAVTTKALVKRPGSTSYLRSGAKMPVRFAGRFATLLSDAAASRTPTVRWLHMRDGRGREMKPALVVIFLGGTMLLQWVPVMAARV